MGRLLGYILSGLVGITCWNLWFHIKVTMIVLVQFCTPTSEPIWFRVISVFWRFVPETLLFATLVCWILYAYFFVCEPETAHKGRQQSKSWKVADYSFLFILLVCTFICFWDQYNLLLLGTYRFDAVVQDPIFQRIVTGMANCPQEFGVTWLCLSGWFVVGVSKAWHLVNKTTSQIC